MGELMIMMLLALVYALKYTEQKWIESDPVSYWRYKYARAGLPYAPTVLDSKTNYQDIRMSLAALSGVPPMAITANEHIRCIQIKIELLTSLIPEKDSTHE